MYCAEYKCCYPYCAMYLVALFQENALQCPSKDKLFANTGENSYYDYDQYELAY